MFLFLILQMLISGADATAPYSAQTSFSSRAMDFIDYSIFQLAHHAKSSKTYRYLSHGIAHLANGKGGQMTYVFDGTGPSQGQTGPSAPKDYYWDGAANQEAYNGGRTGPAYASLGPQAVDGSAICNDRASCKVLSEGTRSWGCASSRCYREKTYAMDTCEPDPLKATMYCYFGWCYGSNVCQGKYICEDTLTPANGMWKSCLLPTPSNGNYDCSDQMDDFNNLINGGHCNQMKCDAGFISQGSMSCTCGVNTGDLQCVLDPNPTTVEFAVTHKIVLNGMSAAQFQSDPSIVTSFRESAATLLGVDTNKIINIVATSTRRRRRSLYKHSSHRLLEGESCSVSYDVKVMSEEAMNTMSVKMAATFSDSTAFTTVLKSAMKTNGVTSVAVDDITSDTSSVPANAGTTGATVPPSSTGPVIDSATSATVASFVVMVAVVVAMFM